MKMDLHNLTITKAHESLVNGAYSAVDLAQAYFDEIKNKNKEINAYLEVYDNVHDQAKMADKTIAALKKEKKEIPQLCGIPFAIKDNILVRGKTTSSASKILETYKATYAAAVISKLKEVGAVFIGRTNMDEYAMGGATESSAFGV